MENSSFKSLNDLGMDEFIFFQQQQSPMDPPMSFDFDQSSQERAVVLDFKRDWCGFDEINHSRPLKHLKTTSNVNSCIIKPEKIITTATTTTTTSDFVNNNNTPSATIVSFDDHHVQVKKNKSSCPFAQERMLAERKRREHLTQRFIALSALLPGLKKMDKVSVLEDAIMHLKQLQQKVELLEANNNMRTETKKNEPPPCARNKSPSSYDDDDDESNYSFGSIISTDHHYSSSLSEIQTRVCNKDVLIHIHCEKKKGVLQKTVGEIEKLNLSVVNSSLMTFGDSSLSISLVAQKDEGFSSDMDELVNNLRSALSKYYCEK